MTSPAEIRARAARIVTAVVERGRSLDAALAADTIPDARPLLQLLSYGTIRWYLELEALLAEWVAAPQRLDPEVRSLVLVGLFQLLHADIPPHAAVSETVNAVRVLGQPRAAGLINAVLRRAQRESTTVLGRLKSDTAVRTAHPGWFVAALARDWPRAQADILDANNEHPPMWLRVNTLRTDRVAYLGRLRAAGIDAVPGGHGSAALRLVSPVDVSKLPGFADGDVSVQDAAAQLAAPLLDLTPGLRVLDACAAPGGKTCHILETQPALAEVVAVDVSAERMRRVRENLQRLNLAATLVTGDVEQPQAWWDGRRFDRILLDVPCSATGVIRRHPDIKLLRRATDIRELALRQGRLLERAWPLLAAGGRLVYASCSVLSAENAAVIGAFLEGHADAADVTGEHVALFPATEQDEAGEGPGHRLRPGEAGMDGFYYACLKKR